MTAFVARGRARLALDYVVQLCGGGLFGTAFAAAGGRGVRQAVAAALAENGALWPLVGVIERRHPDVRAGRWAAPFTSPRAVAVSFAGHALFGVMLGAFYRPRGR